MAFSTIITVVIIGYVFLYVGMIVYDIFFKKGPADLIPKQEDEDIDISDEAGKFQPILIEREARPNGKGQVDSPPVAQPVKDSVKDGIPGKKDGDVITDDEEPSNRKSLREKDGNQNAEDSHLSQEEKSRLEYMERQKQERLRQFGLGKSKDELQKPDNSPTTGKSSEEVASEKENNASDIPKEPKQDLESAESSPKASPTPPKRKRYESAKKKIPLPDDLPKASTFNPVVRIDEDAGLTKHEGGQTVEQLESEVKDTFEDKIALARKIAESGWQLYSDSIPDVGEEDILEPPAPDDGSPPPKASGFNPRQ